MYGDTVANYGRDKAVVDHTRNKSYYLFTVRFDYLWVVFFSGFQQEIQLRIRKHSSKYQLLNNAFSFVFACFKLKKPILTKNPSVMVFYTSIFL